MKHKYDKIEEKQNIISALKRISNLLGKTPTQKDYKQLRLPGELSIEQIYYRFSNYSNALLECPGPPRFPSKKAK